MTYRECYESGRESLKAAGVPEAALDAELLLEYVCGTDRNTLLAHGDREVVSEDRMRYEELIGRRALRIPLQYLTGRQDFMGLEFAVNEHVLIPRQDTEILVEEVMRHLHDGMRILDMCTGSGCILISLLRYSNDCQGVGADISPEALAVADANARRLIGPENIRFLRSDLFREVEGKFEIIVSNPPYIGSGVIPTLMPEVREHEPLSALDGGADGLDFYRRIAGEAPEYLAGGGMLFVEIGCDQGAQVQELFARNGFAEVRCVRDYAGLDRVVCGTLGS
ncbi:MAG: peptide chain release factor N(5)-glutamine methyltransferase [Clostridium sp.]|nr:peptide chain release factor N(5)-glutamine methyltransferase [Acetatifactor muris]MCM1526798.1 peptide chain release factor N(5)-glutamine methyltransferase [Bacteroides sp.]MCM1563001.1 peptide chain release factor N(5)-glutamine methyltransferase [Clostridium sp.]